MLSRKESLISKYDVIMTNIEYINLSVMSKRLSVAPRTLRSWISDPDLKLPVYKVKGLLLFRWSEIEQWLGSYKIKTIDIDVMVDELFNNLKE